MVVSAGQPKRRNSMEIKLEKFSSCVDLGLEVVEQEVKTEELEGDTEEYLTYQTSPETEVNEILDQRMNSETKHFYQT